MLAIQFLVGQMNVPLRQLAGFLRTWQDARLSMERISEWQQLPDEEQPVPYPTDWQAPQDITISHLSFAYNPLVGNILQDISCTLPAGKTTAIVGASGSGKTTFIKLLLGFYPPTHGHIQIGGSTLKEMGLKKWRQQCGAVLQDGHIFSDSLLNNIIEGQGSPNREQLQAALTISCLQEFVQKLPQGLQTQIGVQGSGISQGQRQRILMARAVYKQPHYLFLDEATNALDAQHEKDLLQNLETFANGKTVVVVAHRLSTIRHADHIILIHEGRIAEQGTHETLIQAKGLYYQLVQNQLSV
ncbi:MAG: ABC transporter ATP-binding protein [Saprospiraceae bacterium]